MHQDQAGSNKAPPMRPRTTCSAILSAAALVAALTSARGQIISQPSSSRGSNYVDYYKSAYQQTRSPSSAAYVGTYLRDTYYLHRDTVSPYLNLTRPQNSGTMPNYQTYVRPEVQRRQSQSYSGPPPTVGQNLPAPYASPRSQAGPPPPSTRAPSYVPSNYYRRFFGGL